MTATEKTPPKRRANDVETASPALEMAADDPERLYTEWRGGQRSLESLALLVPLNVIFLWQARQRISDPEFAALMAGLEIQEVELRDLPNVKSSETDAEQQRMEAAVAAFKSRMGGFDVVTLQDAITELDMKPVLLSKTPLADGVGFRLAFARGPEDGPAKPGTPPELTVIGRAYIASQSMQTTVKCEAVFAAPGMEHELYCRVLVPLPLHKGGRRRLLVSVLDNETRQPVKLPPAVAEVFHEKNLFDLRLLKKGGAATPGLGSAVKGAFGRLFKS